MTGIIVAAGSGERMKGPTPKQFLEICGKPVLAHTIEKFEECEDVGELVVVVPAGSVDGCQRDIVERWGYGKVVACVEGGKERQDSVARGLGVSRGEMVCIHDGVRPAVSPRLLSECVRCARLFGSAISAVPVRDTIKKVQNQEVVLTLERSELWEVQTPQVFERGLLLRALEKARQDGFLGTDESSLVERIGASVHVVMGSYDNIKITSLEDLRIVEAIIRRGEEGCA